ncbi:thiaminase (transcriptional activator TenA) [Jannaschia faecimaris]|uniref:Thiaminase (Transcriptional activator TenA) n=1 Tax=Jannaschia faecimaris TaxID=1244108 RepID=A0A1H3P4P7_9RHOB|nr:TenA family protein [Jannaschia faecimaris]SDY95359.1 thiaminase (transcriptional activator TenA) [Jannaschia faecimaris]
MTFTQELWSGTSALQDAILTMPFNRALSDGTLPTEVFRGYIVQDAHYLEGFARSLAIAAGRAPDADAIALLAGGANGAIAAERQLHTEYMTLYGITPAQFSATPPSRSCDHYISFLIRHAAVSPFPVAVCAILPCFWIYNVVGQHIHALAAPDHPYRAWVDTYASEAFGHAVQNMLDLTNRLAQEAGPETRAAMHHAFAQASWHEWMFWQSADDGETWPNP